MQNIIRQQYLHFEILSKKVLHLYWIKILLKWFFLSHIERISKTHKQIKQSAYVFFLYGKTLFNSFSIKKKDCRP